MESEYSRKSLISHIMRQLIHACDMIISWNERISTANEYPSSPEGMEKMAATCMMIQAIGEGIKKIDRLAPGYLSDASSETQWKQIIGLRDHISHGYFNLDADIIFDVAKNEIPRLKLTLIQIS